MLRGTGDAEAPRPTPYRWPMTWPDELAHGYDERTVGVTDDIAFYVGLAAEADGPIVELAIGSGRVAVPIARATGRPVIGIDSSPSMLELARRRAEAAGVDLDLQLGDMGDLRLDGEPLRSFLGFVRPAFGEPYLTVISLFAEERVDVRLIRGPEEAYGVFHLTRRR